MQVTAVWLPLLQRRRTLAQADAGAVNSSS
jgi:hypothetical protein